MTFRLKGHEHALLSELTSFFASQEFVNALADKFEVDAAVTSTDGGIQKYLDGYEISPHPDVRRKAMTYMVNINPSEESAQLDIHTHYMKFKDKRRYVQEYWTHNIEAERCWVPWDWCETTKLQTANNSIVIFSPGNETIHAVKASYDHLATQRTQIYGNLWYNENPCKTKPSWTDLDIRCKPKASRLTRIKQALSGT